MKKRNGLQAIKWMRCILLLGVFLCSVFTTLLFSEASVGVSLNIRELLVLEVYTTTENYINSDQSKAQVSTLFNPDDPSIQIRVRLCVSANQSVQLRVQSHGDLMNSQGDIFPVSGIGWHAVGPGFNDGILSKSSAQIMGTWKGPGIYDGNINYYFIQLPSLDGDFTQIITYSLISL